eukprot:CAMPEP_0172420714 /NCGR_PEP_ID=MMETSP1064-20121228/7066_1 /TAXON_ID=202472 /ORGANISM="Aulacoseira subarctica , Strain CCAP 1002/5" /LENGTH=255 /DNA_ID=CAMNT_0013160799 /DNA_START=162 /DNA_END=929 /DNA_ORIENTATION=-
MVNSWAVVDAFGFQQVPPVQLRERYPSFRSLQRIQTAMPSTIDNINILYPQSEAALRNAASRKDGYWPFIAKNETPPQDFTYGEFPLDFFESLLTLAVASCPSCPDGVRSNAELIDLGSGSGRLVMTAASSSNRWRKVRGIEILPSLHELALNKLRDASTMGFLSTEVQFENCDWSSHDLNLSTADVVFSYTTALRSSGSVLSALTEAIRLKLKPGCVVVTTDYELGHGFTLVASADGRNEGAGGECTGYVFIKD